jgi:hypothetical protein
MTPAIQSQLSVGLPLVPVIGDGDNPTTTIVTDLKTT